MNALKIAKNVMNMDVFHVIKIYSCKMTLVLISVILDTIKIIKNVYLAINLVMNARTKKIVHHVYLVLN